MFLQRINIVYKMLVFMHCSYYVKNVINFIRVLKYIQFHNTLTI